MNLPANHEELVAKLCEMAASQAGVDATSVSCTTHLEADLQFDSLDRVDFTMKIEDAFDVSIPDEAAERVRTVGDAAELLKSHFTMVAP